MDKGKSAMPLLALVAIVAVVAVVMLVLQGRTPSSEEAVAGEAFRAAKSSPSPTEIAPVEEGLTPCNPVFVNSAEFVRRFGTSNVLGSYSASEVCSYLGYNRCVAGQMSERLRYFGSTDGTCDESVNLADKPITQVESVDNYLVNCAARGNDDLRGIPKAAVCQDYVGDYQDTMIGRSLNGVLCCS